MKSLAVGSRRTFLATLVGLTLLVTAQPVAAQAPATSAQPAATAAEQPGPATTGYGLLKNDPRAYQGYTLLSPLQNSKTTFLMDMQGRVVKSWPTEFNPASSAYLQPNGNLLRAGEIPTRPWSTGPAIGGRVQEFTWDGELVWDFTYYTEKSIPHHDYTKLPNGNVILIMIERKTAEEAIAAGRVPAFVANGDMSLDGLVEIKPTGKTTGEVVWEWKMWDHLVQDYDPTKANFGDVAAHPELVDINWGTNTAGQRAPVATADNANASESKLDTPAADGAAPGADGDRRGRGGRGDRGGRGGGGGRGRGSSDWTHTNAVAYNADLDQLMISVHNLSEVWIIDHSTTTAEAAGHTGGRSGKGGDLLYRWGNPQVYRAGTADDQRLFVQHNTHWIPKGLPGEGHMLVFNNGRRTSDGRNYSSVDEIVLPVDSQGRYTREPGQKYGPAEPVWSYVAPNPPDFYSSFISGTMRLPNGNTLICSGANGIMFEVTPAKEVVWQYNNPQHLAPGARGGGGGNQGNRGGGGPNPRSLFRAYRYGPDFPGLAGKTLTPGKTLEDYAAPPTATESSQ